MSNRIRHRTSRLDRNPEDGGYSWSTRAIAGVALLAISIGGYVASDRYDIPQRVTQDIGHMFGQDIEVLED